MTWSTLPKVLGGASACRHGERTSVTARGTKARAAYDRRRIRSLPLGTRDRERAERVRTERAIRSWMRTRREQLDERVALASDRADTLIEVLSARS